jgi:hypothetical protein
MDMKRFFAMIMGMLTGAVAISTMGIGFMAAEAARMGAGPGAVN